MTRFDDYLDKMKEKLREIDPNADFSQGSIPYDLLAPMAKVLEESLGVMDSLREQMDIYSVSLPILKIWAEPRIGLPRSPTSTRVRISGENVDHNEWILMRDDRIVFSKEEGDVQNDAINATCTKTGFVDVRVGDAVYTSEGEGYTARITQILYNGKEEESIEEYRRRYIESLTIDSQAGLGTFYETRISDHALVGTCGVNYDLSRNRTVYVTAVSTTYESMSDEDRNTVRTYFTTNETNIVPIGQRLEICTPDAYDIHETKIFIRNRIDLDVQTVVDMLEKYRQDVLTPTVIKSRSQNYTVYLSDIRNYLITTLSQYGTMESIEINGVTDSIVLHNQVFAPWTTGNVVLEDV